MSVQQQWQYSLPEHSQLRLCATKSLHLCIFSGCVTLDTDSPCPAVMQICTISVIHEHNMVSVFLKQMSLKTFFLTHTSYTPALPESTLLTHTHNTTLSKNIAAGNRGIITRNEAKGKSGQWELSYRTHPKMSGGKEPTWSLAIHNMTIHSHVFYMYTQQKNCPFHCKYCL